MVLFTIIPLRQAIEPSEVLGAPKQTLDACALLVPANKHDVHCLTFILTLLAFALATLLFGLPGHERTCV